MPINTSALQSSENQYVLADVAQPVGRALAALEHARGNGWWHLVVDLGAGRYGAIKFDDLTPLAQEGGAGFFRRPLGDLVGEAIPEAAVVEQEAMETNEAIDLAYESPGQLVVVTQAGHCIGILNVGLMVFDEAPLLDLFGEFKQLNREEYDLWSQEAPRTE